MANSPFIPTDDYQTYDQVPLLRKRWFLVLTILAFLPVPIFVLATGKAYAEANGEVKEYSEKSRKMMLYGCIGLLVLGVLYNL